MIPSRFVFNGFAVDILTLLPEAIQDEIIAFTAVLVAETHPVVVFLDCA